MAFGLIFTLVTNCVCVEVLKTCKSSVAGKKGYGRKRTSRSGSVLESIMCFAIILVSTCSLLFDNPIRTSYGSMRGQKQIQLHISFLMTPSALEACQMGT
jgi:hypothetical protein